MRAILLIVCVVGCLALSIDAIETVRGRGALAARVNGLATGAPMNAAEAKLAAARDAIAKKVAAARGKNFKRGTDRAQMDLADETVTNKIGKVGGNAAELVKKLVSKISEEAAEGFRDMDRMSTSKSGETKFEYQVSKGQFTTARPKTPGFATLATAKIKKLQSSLCKHPDPKKKETCKNLLGLADKIVGSITGKVAQGLDVIKNLARGLSFSFLEEESDSSLSPASLAELDASAEYKIYGGGAHHEMIICEAMKAADISSAPAVLVTKIREHFGADTDCSWAYSKTWSTNLQWWLTIGARWNDVPCLGTDAAVFKDEFIETCYDYWMNDLMKRSHDGDRAYWHSMTNRAVRKTHAKQSDIVNSIANQAVAWLAQGTTLSSGNALLWKPFLWNLGRTAHMLTDSYACGHVVRANDGAKQAVLFFQDYDGQDHDLHGNFDKEPVVNTNAGTKRAIAVIKSIVKIFFNEVGRKWGGTYKAATAYGGANGAAEIAAFIKGEVFPFYTADHANYSALGCNMQAVTPKGEKASCPKAFSRSKADPATICADSPKSTSGQLV